MSDEQFTKLFMYMEKRFGELEGKLETTRSELKADINRVYNLLDKNIKQQETDEQERLVMSHQLSRHEAWIEKAAPKLGVSYDPSVS